jgi:hypothetical protein
LLERLGGGGMGDVYLAREQASERLVAMKFLRHPGDPGLFERFLIELRVLAGLDHPGIVRVLAHDFLRADPFFTMEYLTGGSLSRARDGADPLPPEEAVRLIRLIAAAVAAAHAREVLHRDLKPSNILLTADGAPKVADFGLAKRLDEVDPVTRTGDVLGTPGYLPPEQISRKNGDPGTWSDVYGLGATLFALLTGRAPFVGPTTEEIIHGVLADAPPRLRALRSEVPLGLEAIVLKCLEKDPKDRYQTVAELLADLDRYEAGQKPVAPALTRWRRAKRWARRRRLGLAVGAGVLVAAVALIFALVPKSPEQLKKERLEAIRAKLLAGKPVELVPDKGEPAWYEAPAGTVQFGDNPARTKDDPGGCYFHAAGLTVVKLLDPPIDRYRVKLHLQHVSGVPSPEPVLGFCMVYKFTDQPDGWQEHSFLSVGYSDRDLDNPKGPALPPAVVVGSRCYANPPGRLPAGHLFGNRLARKPLLDARKALPGLWRTIVVDVSPEHLRVFWDPPLGADGWPDPGASPFAEHTVEAIRAHRAAHNNLIQLVFAKQAGRQFARLPDWSPRASIGVWAQGADVAVKNVVVDPQ